MSGGGPPKDIIQRYSPSTMRDHTESCHYDNLREHGFSPEKARETARKAAEHTQRGLDSGAGGSGKTETTTGGHRRNRFRAPFPWEDEAEDEEE